MRRGAFIFIGLLWLVLAQISVCHRKAAQPSGSSGREKLAIQKGLVALFKVICSAKSQRRAA
jgi:hypothetical protein